MKAEDEGKKKGKCILKRKLRKNDCFISTDWKLLQCLKYRLKYILLPKRKMETRINPVQQDK